MWIKRSEYDNLTFTANKNEDAARVLQHLSSIKESGLYFYENIVVVHRDTFDKITKKSQEVEDEIKELEAELAWYKVKYQELKQSKTLFIKTKEK